MIINKKHASLFCWIFLLIAMGFGIGWFTKPEVNLWYATLNLSPLTPPNYVFPVVWTLLYGVLGYCGWLIFDASSFSGLKIIKFLYILQLILNWSWSPLFFSAHLIQVSLLVLLCMNLFVLLIIFLSFSRIKIISILMTPYLTWLLFATYLSFYVWQHN